MAETLDPVIHQQTRLQIISALYRNGRASFTDLRDGLGLTAGNLASHVGRLEASGYVRSRRRLSMAGQEVHYVITSTGVQAFDAYTQGLQQLIASATAGLPRKQ